NSLEKQGVDKTKEIIMSPLVNYVLPSIEPAKDISFLKVRH
ncbi:hypothetical protein Q604_UNBC14123G0002, partial [human gut metagenome]